MGKMTLKTDLTSETITLPLCEFARIAAIASNYAALAERQRATEAKNARMRDALTRYQTKCERSKASSTSGAGASKEPQENKNGCCCHETEGRVSGGERATN